VEEIGKTEGEGEVEGGVGDGETFDGGMSSGGKARINKKLEKEVSNWAGKFQRLKRFEIKHGHVQVKKSSPDDQDLYWWIKDQRAKFKHKKLSLEQVSTFSNVSIQ
jgi:hypothetical protein